MASLPEPAQPGLNPAAAPRVFISYSHDSPAHADQALALADRLRGHGIDAVIDQYETAPPEGWNRWMRAQIKRADFVLSICTETYKRRAEGDEQPGVGRGVNREGLVIDQQIYDDDGRNHRFIAVVLRAADRKFIPDFLTPYQNESVETDAAYDTLYRRLTHQPGVQAPPLGKLRALPTRARQTTPTALWTIPPRNPYFSGREEYLEKLYQALHHNGGTAALTQAIQGLGGIGKTQTAIEYAHRHRAEYSAAFFIVTDSRSAIISGYASLARVLDLPEKDEREIEKAARAAKHWFDTNARWLLILDNVDEMADVKNWLPDVSQGHRHVIITTRVKATGLIAKAVELPKMTPTEGAKFLLNRAKIENPTEADRTAAEEISKEVGGLPLALDQAGAYIEEASLSVEEYLDLYRREGKNLRARTYETADHQSVHVTFTLAFVKLSEPAKDILRMCAFLAPAAIPEEILTAVPLGNSKDPHTAFIDARTELVKYSLIERNPANKTFEIHRLVQDVVRDEMDDDAQRQQAECAVNALAAVFPGGKFETWPQGERLLTQAKAATQRIEEFSIESRAGSLLLDNTALYLEGRGQYVEAEPLYQRALLIAEETLGAEHPHTLTYMNNLAVLYYYRGRYAEAEPLYLRTLAAKEKVLGAEHPDTLISLSALALLYSDQGRYAEAEPLLLRALATGERVLGAEHYDTLIWRNNLAVLYRNQGRYTEAEPLHKRELAACERVLGPEHPNTLTSLNNLAMLYKHQGRYAEAEPLYARAVAGAEKVLGPTHPKTIVYAHNYARLLRKLGREDEARALEARFPKNR